MIVILEYLFFSLFLLHWSTELLGWGRLFQELVLDICPERWADLEGVALL